MLNNYYQISVASYKGTTSALLVELVTTDDKNERPTSRTSEHVAKHLQPATVDDGPKNNLKTKSISMPELYHMRIVISVAGPRALPRYACRRQQSSSVVEDDRSFIVGGWTTVRSFTEEETSTMNNRPLYTAHRVLTDEENPPF